MDSATGKAYLAGLIDGEGHIGISTSKPRAYGGWHNHYMIVTVSNTYLPVLTEAQSTWGGSLVVRKANKTTETVIGNLRWSSLAAVKMLEAVRPYMRIKQAQADLALTFASEMKERPNGTHPLTEAEWDRREELRLAIRQLNRPNDNLKPVPFPKKPPRECGFCGNEFTDYVSAKRLYCSRSCTLKASWRRRKAKE